MEIRNIILHPKFKVGDKVRVKTEEYCYYGTITRLLDEFDEYTGEHHPMAQLNNDEFHTYYIEHIELAEAPDETLLQYLCMALPYKVICSIYRVDDYGVGWRDEKLTGYFFDGFSHEFYFGESPMSVDNILKIKPYLRPMSSMTDEELFEVQDIIGKGVEIRDIFISIVDSSINSFTYLELQAVFKWLLKNHFDFMELIPKNLAVEVTKENNPYENNTERQKEV